MTSRLYIFSSNFEWGRSSGNLKFEGEDMGKQILFRIQLLEGEAGVFRGKRNRAELESGVVSQSEPRKRCGLPLGIYLAWQ